jgi:hypothetical protein
MAFAILRRNRSDRVEGVNTMQLRPPDEQAPRGTGTFLGMPYDFRAPSWERVRERAWNPADQRLFTPKSFGWGYDINLHELLARLGVIRR